MLQLFWRRKVPTKFGQLVVNILDYGLVIASLGSPDAIQVSTLASNWTPHCPDQATQWSCRPLQTAITDKASAQSCCSLAQLEEVFVLDTTSIHQFQDNLLLHHPQLQMSKLLRNLTPNLTPPESTNRAS